MQKKKVVAGGKIFFLVDARKTSLMPPNSARKDHLIFQSNRGIVVKCKSNKKARGEEVTAGIHLCYLRLNSLST